MRGDSCWGVSLTRGYLPTILEGRVGSRALCPVRRERGIDLREAVVPIISGPPVPHGFLCNVFDGGKDHRKSVLGVFARGKLAS
jgi:hypothetical protein